MDDVGEAISVILEEYPSEAQNPRAAMSERVESAFRTIEDVLGARFATTASGKYEVSAPLDRLDRRGSLPVVLLEPEGEQRHDRNPRVRVGIVFPADMHGVFLLLYDVRGESQGPPADKKKGQREDLQTLLVKKATKLTDPLNKGQPQLFVDAEGAGEGTLHSYAKNTILHRFYGREEVPGEGELIRDLDALVRLRELYDTTYKTRDLSDLVRPGGGDRGGVESERSGRGSVEEFTANESAGGSEGLAEATDAGGEADGEIPDASNLILYGPPGTGKTYLTRRKALELCGEVSPGETVDQREVRRRFHRLSDAGRIEFVTFHQSFGYEEFVEGIRPVMAGGPEDSTEGDGGVEYQCEMGVFKKISLLAASEGLEFKRGDREFEARWRALQRRVEGREEVKCKSVRAKYRVETVDSDRFRLVRVDGDSGTTYTVEKSSVKRWWNHRHELGQDFMAIDRHTVENEVSKPGGFTPNWVMYRLIMEQKPDAESGAEELRAGEGSQEKRISDAQTYLDSYREGQGEDAFTGFGSAKPYVLIIDEINRGNISKILGELITLLEPTKRLKRDDELVLQLPYSKERFGVPPNLHVLGTMNTADRSIALLDAALRRRFDYEEMMPDAVVVVESMLDAFGVETVEELEDLEAYLVNLVPALLETLNERIEYLYDRDHQIGHSYFMGIEDLVGLRDAFVDRVVPLLQEYFYSAWDQLCMVLGCPYDRQGRPQRSEEDGHAHGEEGYVAPLIEVSALDEQQVLRVERSDYEDEIGWGLNERFAGATERDVLRQFFEGVLSAERRQAVVSGDYVRRVLDESDKGDGEGFDGSRSEVEETA